RYTTTGLTLATLLAFAVPLAMTLLGFSPDRIAALRDWSTSDPATDLRRTVEAYAAIQVVVFVVVAGLLVKTRLGAMLTPRALKRDRVHAEALSQFRARGIGATRARTGVLIFVSLSDRIAEVVADAGIYARVEPRHWATTVHALVEGIKAGSPGKGFVDAIALAGTVLAEHFPAETDNPDELPNRLIEI
ncbi:MAG: TPM domain-containing protein, partial [Janthinobacterium lividum]